MNEATKPWYLEILIRSGFPALLLFLIMYWAAPIASQLIDGHMKFMVQQAESGRKTAEAVDRSSRVQEEIKTIEQEQTRHAEEQSRHADESLQLQKRIYERLERSGSLGAPSMKSGSIDRNVSPLVLFATPP